MKVGFFSPSWPPSDKPNGIVTYASTMRQCLRAADVEAVVLNLSGSQHSEAGVISVTSPPRSFGRRLRDFIAFRLRPDAAVWNARCEAIRLAARRASREHRIDLLEIEETFGWAACLDSGADATMPAVAVRMHGPWFLVGPALGLEAEPVFDQRVARELHAFSVADGVSSPSRFTLEAVQRRLGKPLACAEVIPNPIFPAAADRIWQASGADPELVLFVGRIDRVKGADVVLRAFGKVHAARPGMRLLMVGPDSGFSDERGHPVSRDALVQRCMPAAARAAVKFAGAMAPAEVAVQRLRAAVIVVASRYETFPYTLLEALNAGCPTVCSAGSGMSELFSEGRTALGFAPGDDAALASAIERVLAGPAAAAEMGHRARLAVAESFSPEVITPRMIGFYQRVIESRRRKDR